MKPLKYFQWGGRIRSFVPPAVSLSTLTLIMFCFVTASVRAQTYSVLHQFIYPANPNGGLALSDTTLYGTTGYQTTNYGTVFKVNTDGSGYTTIKNFDSSAGYDPQGRLLLSGTTLYGTTTGGQNYYEGKIFKVNTDGSGFAVLMGFNYISWEPHGGLVLSGTMLYGTTYSGGSSNRGTVFRLNTNGGGFAVLKSFTGASDGANPNAGLLLSDTTLYGTTRGGWQFRGRHDFQNQYWQHRFHGTEELCWQRRLRSLCRLGVVRHDAVWDNA
jgi:uncharacterized repeat protein (TIGR03803 family)